MGFFGDDHSAGITNSKCVGRMYRMTHPFACPMERRLVDKRAYNEYHNTGPIRRGGMGTKSRRRRASATTTSKRRRKNKKNRKNTHKKGRRSRFSNK